MRPEARADARGPILESSPLLGLMRTAPRAPTVAYFTTRSVVSPSTTR
jgi:hypothetical protein